MKRRGRKKKRREKERDREKEKERVWRSERSAFIQDKTRRKERVRVEWKKAKAREEKKTEMRLSALIFLRRTRCYLLTGRSNNNALCMTPSNLPNLLLLCVQHTKEQHTSSSPPLYKRRKRE